MIANIIWSIGTLIRNGVPSRLLYYDGGVGDELLISSVAHEYAVRGYRKPWVAIRNRALYEHNDYVMCLDITEPKVISLARMLRVKIVDLAYSYYDPESDRDSQPNEHIIAAMCRKAGLAGNIALRPYLDLDNEESRVGRIAERQVAIQSTGMSAKFKMKNKEWGTVRFQTVTDLLVKKGYTVVQLGGINDPLLNGAEDYRGKTTLRGAAAILKASQFFVGQVGGLMHLARAVDCRSVVVYGGREKPDQTGYICNENLTSDPNCSPCWYRSYCPYNRQCMTVIQAEDVVQAVTRLERRMESPLETATVVL